ncbi:DUF7009 family protein [Dyella amyloliquefaciens]|uniref:DUF7009 family protein n=1 Tax=Dyella amyloliquefaciens TaxID=1770545 RepID=UPI00102E7B7E|nr:hypothetical protein [Dyella amyloliquefaciens]
MKLQIEGQSLRVRIGEAELTQLLAGGTVESHTRFAQAFAMGCALRLGGSIDAGLSGRADAWLIELPEAAVRAHAARLPTREGLTFNLPTGSGDDVLELLFDVDVRDSVRQRRSS